MQLPLTSQWFYPPWSPVLGSQSCLGLTWGRLRALCVNVGSQPRLPAMQPFATEGNIMAGANFLTA